MPRIYGNAERAGIGGAGLDVPLDPRLVSAQLAAARLAAQAERQAAAEDAAAAVAKPKRRPRSSDATKTFSVASMSPVPARVAAAPALPTPPPVPAVVDVIEDLVPAGPVPCKAPDCSEPVTPEFLARTGQQIHPPCLARQQAGASTNSTTGARPRRTRELVAAGRSPS
jgi:hypothetical protein